MSTVLDPPTTTATPTSAEENLQRLMAEQGVTDTSTADHLAKVGVGLWDSDEEFDDFLAILRQLRHDGEPSS